MSPLVVADNFTELLLLSTRTSQPLYNRKSLGHLQTGFDRGPDALKREYVGLFILPLKKSLVKWCQEFSIMETNPLTPC
jgi:hypothetical protein